MTTVRRKGIRFREFPDFLELLAMALSAGLNLERAWALAVVYFSDGELKEIVAGCGEAFSAGRPREEVLADLSGRLNDHRLSPVVSILTHALKRGTPLQSILIEQAAALRATALFAVEKRAQTASVRILIPVVLFLLPTLFIILFAPLVLRFAQGQLL